MPRVSVIVPAHNASAYLGDTLGSLLAQTYADWEAIVVDDASQDDTLAVANAADGRIRALRSEVNLGPAGARNLALEQATGELVALLDADDAYRPQYLARQVQRFDAESARGQRVGIVACNAAIRARDGLLGHTYLDQFPYDVEPLTLERVLRRNCIYVSALVPRAAGEEVGWFSTELFGTEDHDLWIRILERGYRAVLNREVLAEYRHMGGSVSANIARQGLNNRLTYVGTLERGRLTAGQRRIARQEIRYNRAMEAVAAAVFDGRRSALVRRLPTLVGVAATRRDHWGDWVRVLRARGR